MQPFRAMPLIPLLPLGVWCVVALSPAQTVPAQTLPSQVHPSMQAFSSAFRAIEKGFEQGDAAAVADHARELATLSTSQRR